MNTPKINILGLTMLCLGALGACGQSSNKQIKNIKEKTMQPETNNNKAEATFGAGCFWCVEAVFQQLDGVDTVISGYSGGTSSNPTYKEVCSGNSGHVEVCRIIFNPQKITFNELLQAFFLSHDPTTLNRQGNDIGTQYRSVVFFNSEEQKTEATRVINELNAAKAYSSPIITAVEPLSNFYIAEDYHQNYYNLNSNEGYCRYVIKPKLDKLTHIFKGKLKQK